MHRLIGTECIFCVFFMYWFGVQFCFMRQLHVQQLCNIVAILRLFFFSVTAVWFVVFSILYVVSCIQCVVCSSSYSVCRIQFVVFSLLSSVCRIQFVVSSLSYLVCRIYYFCGSINFCYYCLNRSHFLSKVQIVSLLAIIMISSTKIEPTLYCYNLHIYRLVIMYCR